MGKTNIDIIQNHARIFVDALFQEQVKEMLNEQSMTYLDPRMNQSQSSHRGRIKRN